MNNDRGSTQVALISLIIAVIGVLNIGATNPEIRQSFDAEKNQDSYVQNNPAYTDIKSDVGAEAQLKELEQLLKKGDFKAADEKTAKIRLYVANREKEGYIDDDSMAKFSCTDLRTIDQLWVNNSNGRFGFSVQKRIWEENGKDWDKLYNAIGWKEGEKWKSYSELTFQKNAEKGHLPRKGVSLRSVGGEEWEVSFDVGWVFVRFNACKI